MGPNRQGLIKILEYFQQQKFWNRKDSAKSYDRSGDLGSPGGFLDSCWRGAHFAKSDRFQEAENLYTRTTFSRRIDICIERLSLLSFCDHFRLFFVEQRSNSSLAG